MFPILMYHDLGETPADSAHGALCIPPAEFRFQLDALTRWGYRSVSDREAAEGPTSRKPVWLTFDDGHRNNFEHGLGLLVDSGHRATFFVTVEPCLRGDAGFMDRGMLREMLAAGMSVGSHTLTHPRLARLSPEDLRREVADSRLRLEDALGCEVLSFCYPYGNWNERVIEEVRRAGYRVAVSTIRGNRNAPVERFLLKRAMVQPGRVGIRFRYLLSPFYHAVHSFKNRGKWKPGKP